MNQPGKTAPDAIEPSPTQEMKREIIEFVKMIAWFLILFFVIKTYVIEGYEVQGPSMAPTLHDRERILVFKLPHNLAKLPLLRGMNAIKQGNIVVFDSPVEPDKRYVKRVIAKGPRKRPSNTVEAEQHLSGAAEETVTVQFDKGTIYVNKRRISEDYLKSGPRRSREYLPEVRIAAGEYYMLGDNTNVSKDSRSFGAVRDEDVIGRAILRFWPPSKISLFR